MLKAMRSLRAIPEMSKDTTTDISQESENIEPMISEQHLVDSNQEFKLGNEIQQYSDEMDS